MKSTWSVVVIYEGDAARDTGVEFCNRLVERFWARCGFDVSWFSCASLQKDQNSLEAATKAASADIVVFISVLHNDPPSFLKHWLDLWLSSRGEKEGTLVALTVPAPPPGTCPLSEALFRRVAHRAGMDFANQLPEDIEAVPENPESYSARANEVTSVLTEILHPHPPALAERPH